MMEILIQNLVPWGGAAGIILALARLVTASCHGAAEVMLAQRTKPPEGGPPD